MNPESFEFFEGTKTVKHDDGSTTYITYEHQPYMEPLTPKQTAATIAAVTLVVGGFIALPAIVDRLEEWSHHRAQVRKAKKAQKLKDINNPSN